MPVDPTRLSQQQFTDRLMQSEEVLQTNQESKSGKAGKGDKAKKAGGNLTVEHVGDTQGLDATGSGRGIGATQPQQVELPAPTVDPAVMMMLVQSLSSKTNANQTTSTGNQLAVSDAKMHDSIKKYEDNIKKEAEDAKKAHHKKSVGEWISGAVDAVEFVAGAALVATGVGTVAGVALMATAVVNATDLALTASGAVHGKGAGILNDITIAADVTIGVATLGVGIASGMMTAAAELAPDLAEDGIELGDMSTQSMDEAPDELSETEDADEADDGTEEDVGDDGEDEGGLKQLEKMFDKELEQEFSENFSEDVTEDGADTSSDDDGNGMKQFRKGQIVKAAVKATFGMYAKGAGIAGAGTGADMTWMKVTTDDLTKKEDRYAADAEDAQKGEAAANMQIQSAIKQMQTQVDEYQKISTDASNILQAYNSNMTDTGIQGFA